MKVFRKRIIRAMTVGWIAWGALLVAGAETNLVVNGDFEMHDPLDRSRPLGWDPPDGLGIVWMTGDRDHPDRRHIRMDTRISEQDMVSRWRDMGFEKWIFPDPAAGPIAATYGLRLESARFSVVSGMSYRVSFDVSAPGNGAKVWVRGYSAAGKRRYETVVHVRAPPDAWVRETREFNPTRHRPDVVWMRVMLFAYWPPGVYGFDNIRVEPVNP